MPSNQTNLFKGIVVISVFISFYFLLILSPLQIHSPNNFDEVIISENVETNSNENHNHDNTNRGYWQDERILKGIEEDEERKKSLTRRSEFGNNYGNQLVIDQLTIANGDVESLSPDDIDLNNVTNKCDLHVAMIFTHGSNAFPNLLNEKLKRSLGSVLINSREVTSLCVHLIVDASSHASAKYIINDSLKQLISKQFNRQVVITFHSNDFITHSIEYLLSPLKSHFSYKPNSYYSHSLFYISLILHRVFPSSINQMILLDIDVQLRAKLTDLNAHFLNFTHENIIGIANEQQPVYRHILYDYRKSHLGTHLGNPVSSKSSSPTSSTPNKKQGIPGFNSGVLLLHLDNMRQSKLYNSLLSAQIIDQLSTKYLFRGHLGDQDFYTLISFDAPQLFAHLPCEWNRQLCQWWRYHGYANVFDDYNRCDKPIKLFHGNCNSVMPKNNNQLL